MSPSSPSRWLHRIALFTVALALLLPVSTGAVVTTMKAGMAFADWPSSDGYFILTYPWLKSAKDQFVEHGHRLAGMVIGVAAIFLVVQTFLLDKRSAPRYLATAILGAVITQGLLGGARVLLDEQLLALLHGDFAALIVSLMAILAVVTRPDWNLRARFKVSEDYTTMFRSAAIVFGALAIQYVLGGFLRHLRDRVVFNLAWNIHPWFALAVILAIAKFMVDSFAYGSPLLRRCGIALAVLVVTQSLLGLATWAVRFGLPDWGIVAQLNSPEQIVICSLHKVLGLSTLMTASLTLFCAQSLKPDAHEISSVNSFSAGVVA
jgi:cytochrome c oxidase assembly protein subunit 15